MTTDGSVLSQESRVLEHRQGAAAQVRLAVSVQGEDGPCERLDPSTHPALYDPLPLLLSVRQGCARDQTENFKNGFVDFN